MTYRSSRSARILSSLALAMLIVPAPYAGISGSNSDSVSIGDLSTEDLTTLVKTETTVTSDKFTKTDLAIMRERRTEATAKIADITAKIAALKKEGKTDDVTTLRLTQLNKELSDLKELNSVLDALINQAIIDTTPTTGGLGGLGGSDDDDSSGSGGNQIIDQIKQAAINSLVQSFLGGGNNALQNLTSSLTGGLTGGLAGGMGNLTGALGGTAGNPTVAAPAGVAEKEKKAAEDAALRLCTPEEQAVLEKGKDKDFIGPRTKEQTATATGDFIGPRTEAQTAAGDAPAFPGKEADDKVTTEDEAKKAVQAAAKPNCRTVDVTTPNPTGGAGDIAGGTQSNKITSIEDAKKFVGKYMCDPSNSNCAGNGQECASLTKYFCPEVGRAGSWSGGSTVKGGNVAVGTCVATFSNNGNYGPAGSPGGASGKSHTGVYLGQNSKGIIMLHQWNGSGGARISTVPWSAWGKNVQQGGNTYKTISFENVIRIFDRIQSPTLLAYNIVRQGLVNLKS
ncbi:MAG: hypothetical protein EON60_09865 [Alphaproteobacteria bacterium]|nr:MAG: hypothetical protein EON60_09865 [Alphaproteobacteria bacterium]